MFKLEIWALCCGKKADKKKATDCVLEFNDNIASNNQNIISHSFKTLWYAWIDLTHTTKSNTI